MLLNLTTEKSPSRFKHPLLSGNSDPCFSKGMLPFFQKISHNVSTIGHWLNKLYLVSVERVLYQEENLKAHGDSFGAGGTSAVRRSD